MLIFRMSIFSRSKLQKTKLQQSGIKSGQKRQNLNERSDLNNLDRSKKARLGLSFVSLFILI